MFESQSVDVHRLRRGRPRHDPDLRRALIVKVALSVFVERGYAETTMELVAARSAVSKATLYTVFGSKRELFAAVVESAIYLEIPVGDLENVSMAKTLEMIVLPEPIEGELNSGDREEIVRMIYREGGQPDVRDIYRKASSKEAAKLTGWLRRQQSKGRLKIDDADMIAQMLINVVSGYPPNQADVSNGPVTRIPYMREFVAIFCRGIAVE